MKKKFVSGFFAALLVTVTLLGCNAAQAAFGAETFSSYTVTGPSNMTTQATVTSQTAADTLQGIINSSSRISKLPSGAEEKASIQLDDSTLYTVYDDGSFVYFVSGGITGKADRNGFYQLLKRYPGPSLYTYAPLPTLSFGTVKALPTESNYTYTRLDGSRCLSSLTTGEIPQISIGAEGIPEVSSSLPVQSITYSIKGDNGYSFQGTRAAFNKETLTGGVYEAQATVLYEDVENSLYKGSITYSITLLYNISPRFEIEHSTLYPGEVALIKAYNIPEGESITVTGDIDFTPSFFQEDPGLQVALLPVNYNMEVGQYTLSISGGGVSQSFVITASDKKFQIQYLTASSSTVEQTIASDKANEEFNTKVLPLRSISDPVKYWDGSFTLPASDSNVTTQFACIRYTNGEYSGRHGGIDLANPRGTPVKAPAAGRVIYSGYLQLTGYTILIEHGYGLKSWYYHMDSVAVKENDMVVQGQKIGEVGSTGFSTGPHLHFAMSVNNVFVDPYQFINQNPLP